jgi:ATP-binding cassette subfamily B protein
MSKTTIYAVPNLGVTKFIFFFIKRYRLNYFLISLCAVVVSVSSNTFWPYISGLLIDAFDALDSVTERSLESIIPLLLYAILYWIVSTLAHSAKGFLFAITRPKFCADIRMSLYELVMKHRHRYFINKHIGDISQRISELPKSAQLISDNVLTIFGPMLISVIVSSAAFFYVHWIVSVMFTVFLLTYIGLMTIMGLKATKYCDIHYRSFAQLFGCIVDSIRNNFNIRIFNGLKNEKQYIEKSQVVEMTDSKHAFFFIEKLKLLLGTWEIVSVAAILWTSVLLWQRNDISVGELTFIANSIFNIMSFMWFAVDEITYTLNEIGICRQGLTLLQDDDKQNIMLQNEGNKESIVVTKGEIQFHNVTFKYRDGNDLFNEKSIKISGKERVGLVGFSGSGKTTFAHLIMRLYDPDGGHISIDGKDIRNCSINSLRSNISFIQQDPILFHRSVMENIRYGKLDATDEEVVDAAQKAHAHDFIIHMTDKYNSHVGEMGAKLSGGQRQRIAIARAILRNAPILIMDEATSALDAVTEKKIQESLSYLMEDKTVIVIAHKLSTVMELDRILVFDKGQIVEEGNHKQLLRKNGYYRKLWEMQQDGIFPSEMCEE